ncbi:MAG TPA: ATP-binding cassette domain-containing protein [Abditibacteriaceae bacterium]|jgi:osmoprotectant transport system ATP-binding protein
MNSTPDALIQFEDVSYNVPGMAQPILQGLSFSVARGETLVLLGESGSGKTTTLRLINRLLLPTAGRVLVEGKTTAEWDAIQLRRHIGYVIQEAGLFPHFSVERNVALVPSLKSDDSASNLRRAHEMLRLVGLDPQTFANRYPHELSGGQRQRVGVARALAADPPLLLLDEPFGALDPLTRSALQQEFKALCADLGKTAVLVTHDVREALLLGTRVALMRAGTIVVLATPQEFLQSEDPGAQAYQQTLQLVQNVA